MTRGQESLEIAMNVAPALLLADAAAPSQVLLAVVRPDDEELAAHAAMCERIEKESKGRCLWLHLPRAA
jgi:DNA polymerase-3 subunit epsilon